ncbi:MAG: methylphosphotriester-DNA--protein-cysteine methyltransferase family protein [Candidatus Heimdallarchaeota archaeon]|nr:methylphosphotriester-DNA--protein-cysteine methyltransferase family protein [Candidatus Heimdallarchaeota archaeon]
MQVLMNAEKMYQICKDNDSRYDGQFYIGVQSTKIYCLPSCKARMPLRKNVSFYRNRDKAISDGLRGCKRCKSEFYPYTQPIWLETLLRHLNEHLGVKLREEDLEELCGANISTIRRYFREYLSTTPNRYHLKLRLEHAKQLLESEELLSIPYLTGFNSLSGFRAAFFKEFGYNPGEKHE